MDRGRCALPAAVATQRRCAARDTGEVVEQVAEWRDHGLSYPILINLSTVQPSIRRGLATGTPFAKILGGLRHL